jgi:glycosyltransferase involved in cell wall biosynthesis
MTAAGNGRPLRLAVYGYVEKTAGSLAGANFLLLDHLLRQGHAIDLYAIHDFVDPKDFHRYPNYRYFSFADRAVDAVWSVVDRLPRGRNNRLLAIPVGAATASRYYRAIERAIRQRHRRRPYDALLTLGLLSPFRLTGLPRVSWTQGTPNGELDAIRRLRGQFARRGDRLLYGALVPWYRWKERSARRLLPYSDLVITGSAWANGSWHELGARPDQTRALPYPIDLDLFRPAAGPVSPRSVTFLHLGRIVPRKRLDLLLEAFRRLRRADPDVRLVVIGGFDYASGAQALVQELERTVNVEYRPGIPRAEVVGVYHAADVVVQPSENENFGSAVAEGLACGLPVVVGPTNGTKDYISPSSFVFPAYEPDAVCEALLNAAAAVRARRAELTADARAAAEQHFAVGHVAERLVGVIRREHHRPGLRA